MRAELLQLIDCELSHTEVGKTFHQQQQYPPPADSNELGTATEPVNVDLNLVESLVQSYSSQLAGETGPASNLLHSMGLENRLTDTMNNRTPPQLFHKMKRTAILAAVKLGLPCTYLHYYNNWLFLRLIVRPA